MDDAAPREHTLDDLPGLIRDADVKKVLLVTGPSARHVELVRQLLAPVEVELFAGARRHVPEDVVAEAGRVLDAGGAGAIVALGGGSAIGLGKALVASRALPFIALPTTYAGSERTSLFGTTKDGKKTTGRDPKVRPLHVVYDARLTADMPKSLTVTSLLNALAHPLGALASNVLADETRARALRAVTLVFGALSLLLEHPADARARAQAQRGAALAADVLEGAKLGTHHALAHRLGGACDLEHGALHSVLLPHSVHRMRAETPELLAGIEAELHVLDLEALLFDVLVRAGVPTSLKALGMSLAALEQVLEATAAPDRALLRAAFHGRRPSRAFRLEDFGLPELVALTGPPLGD